MSNALSNDATIASIINWTPAGGIEVCCWGTQYDRGAAGFDTLHIIRRRTSGRRWQYGLAWHSDRTATVKSLDRLVSMSGDCPAWPWSHAVSDVVSWFTTRAAAFAAATAA